MQSHLNFSFQHFCLFVTYENSFSICAFRYFFFKSPSLYSTSICYLEVSNPFKMNQSILSTDCFNESRPSPGFFGWDGRICPSEEVWVLVSQARNINSHLLDRGRFSVATTYVQHFELLFFFRVWKAFPQACIDGFQGNRPELHADAFEIQFSFGLEKSQLSTPRIWPWKETCKWLTVLHNIESKPDFRSPVKQSF